MLYFLTATGGSVIQLKYKLNTPYLLTLEQWIIAIGHKQAWASAEAAKMTVYLLRSANCSLGILRPRYRPRQKRGSQRVGTRIYKEVEASAREGWCNIKSKTDKTGSVHCIYYSGDSCGDLPTSAYTIHSQVMQEDSCSDWEGDTTKDGNQPQHP